MPVAVESIQFALFLRSPGTFNALKLWSQAIETEPAGFNTISKGHTQANGPVEGSNIVLSVQPDRIDLIIQGTALHEGLTPPFELVDAEAAIATGLRYAEIILKSSDTGRVAVVMQRHVMASSWKDANDKLAELLPAAPIPANSQEVSYQLVSPVLSKTVPLTILRRLCRWQTLNIQLLEVQMGGLQSTQIVTNKYSAHLHADVFMETVQNIDADQAMAALKEVAGHAIRIMEDGIVAVS